MAIQLLQFNFDNLVHGMQKSELMTVSALQVFDFVPIWAALALTQ
jgi:hypothetical protein